MGAAGGAPLGGVETFSGYGFIVVLVLDVMVLVLELLVLVLVEEVVVLLVEELLVLVEVELEVVVPTKVRWCPANRKLEKANTLHCKTEQSPPS